MATDEKYLDDLLKSLEENPVPPRKFNFGNEKKDDGVGSLGVSADDLADMLDKLDEKTIIHDEEGAELEEAADIAEEDDIFAQADEVQEDNVIDKMAAAAPDNADEEDWKIDLDSLLAEADKAQQQEEEQEEQENEKEEQEQEEEQGQEEEQEQGQEQEEAAEGREEESILKAASQLDTDIDTAAVSAEELDVTQLIDGMDGAGEDWEEIGDLLKKSDQNQAIDDDMLALLESVKEEGGGNSENTGEAFDIFAEETADADALPGTSKKSSRLEKKEERRRKRAEKKEKRKRVSQQEEKEQSGENLEKGSDEAMAESSESDFGEDLVSISEDEAENYISDIEDRTESEKKLAVQKQKAEKKPGFFSKLFQLLTQEEEETEAEAKPALDENGEILNELEQEDLANSKKKKKTEKKTKKEKKQKKAGSKEGEDEGEESEGDEADSKGKKKKAKKEKRNKENKEEEKEKPVKILTRKSMMVLVAFCATIIAAIVSLSIFLPDYADKKNARTAFYQGEYETVYELLYNKKLNESDRVIFNRVDIILRLERKLDACKNYQNMGMELEALDALLQGLERYDGLAAQAEAYGAAEEAQNIYRQILTELSDTYQMSEEEARETNSYAAVDYTRKLNSVINGTEFVKPGEEAEPLPPQDVLPEEEEIITL